MSAERIPCLQLAKGPCQTILSDFISQLNATFLVVFAHERYDTFHCQPTKHEKLHDIICKRKLKADIRSISGRPIFLVVNT